MNYKVIKINDPAETNVYYFSNVHLHFEDGVIMIYDNECKATILGLFPVKEYCLIKQP